MKSIAITSFHAALVALGLALALTSGCPPDDDDDDGGGSDLQAGDVFVTELMPEQPAGLTASNAEYVELYNDSDVAIDPTAISIRDNVTAREITCEPGTEWAPGSFLVVPKNTDEVLNGGIVAACSAGVSLSESVALRIEVGGDDGAVELDAVNTYDAFGFDEGIAAQLSREEGCWSAAGNDPASCWCPATTGYGSPPPERTQLGSPGEENEPCDGGGDDDDDDDDTPECAALQAGDIFVTELMPRQPAGLDHEDAEWVELYNGSGQTLDPECLSLEDNVTVRAVLCDPPTEWPPDALLVLPKSADIDDNGGIPATCIADKLALSDAVELKVGYRGPDEAVVEQDVLDYDDDFDFDTGIATQLATDPGCWSDVGNDPTSCWCAATQQYGNPEEGDDRLGTPGSENDPC